MIKVNPEYAQYRPYFKISRYFAYIFYPSRIKAISYYITGRRSSVLIYRDALGLFWYDRYKPILESIINLGASIYLVSKIGIEGVILGTIISSVLTCFLIEPYVLYKFGFKRSVKKYYQKYFSYMLIAIFTCLINIKIVSYTESIDNSLLAFLAMCVITVIIPLSIYYVIFRKQSEFIYLIGLLKTAIKR